MEINGSATANSFGRRTFLKGSAAALGVAALVGAGCAPKTEMEEKEPTAFVDDQVFASVCRGNCGGGCKLDVRVRDGKVVSTTSGKYPDERYNRICSRGLSHLQRIYDPDRLKYPMRRVGERGSGEWEQITWDEAIDEITTKWKQYQAESGDSSVAFYSGAGNFGSCASGYAGRLRGLMGGSSVAICYDNAFFHGNGTSQGVEDCYNSNEITDLINAKTVIMWGANSSESFPQQWHFIVEAKANGAKLITVDPNYTVTAERSDIHVPIRPGTDAIMIMAMINEIVEKGWIDESFIKKSTVGPFLVKESDGKYLRKSDLGIEPEKVVDPNTGAETLNDPIVVRDADGKIGTVEEIADPVYEGRFVVEGIKVTCAYTLLLESCAEWTVERAAEMCDLSADMIREVTELYANGPSSIMHGFGPDHYVNGHKAYFALVAMAAITGNLGKPGASCGLDWSIAGKKFAQNAVLNPKNSKPGPTIPAPLLLDVVNEGQLEGVPIDLRSLYIWVSNPLGNQTDRRAQLEVFDKMDLVVVVDMTMTDTARYADIVLPVVHWFEQWEIMPQTSPYLLIQEKAVDPLYEAKTDVEIVNMLGNAMGFTGEFDYTEESYLEGILTNPVSEAAGVTWDRLKEEKLIMAYPTTPYIHGAGGVFRTPTKRAEFYLENPKPFINYEQKFDVEAERTIYWEPPTEAWPETVGGFEANPLAEKYPLIYTTERNKMKCHTQFGHNPWLLELYPEPILKMNPDDAAPRGLQEGDYVRAFNDRGEAVFKLHMNAGVRPGMVIVPKGWEIDQFQKGHYSDLTSRAMHPVCPNNCYFDALIEVEKA